MSTLFGLIDCNSFYASCQKAFQPELKDRPVIVLSNNDGCVVARSQEAKDLGIPMGAPFFQIRADCLRQRIVVFSSNYALYGDMSRRVMQTLAQRTPEIEIYSIDEAFLHFGKGCVPSLEEAQGLVDTVYQWTGIPTSIGIAPTRTLAKIANRTAKKRREKACVLLDESVRQSILKQFPLADVWGVGRRLYDRFYRSGIRTAWDLAQQNPAEIRRQFSVVQEAMVRELNGESCFGNQQSPPTNKTIQVSRTFGKRQSELPAVEAAIATFAARGAEKLRQQGTVARAIQVYIQTSPFQPVPQYSATTVLPFDLPTDDTLTIAAVARQALEKIFQPGYSYMKAGILLLDLGPANIAKQQGNLFEDPENQVRRDSLMRTLDFLNEKIGKSAVMVGSQLFDPSWNACRESVSPRYTTEWSDLPIAK